MRRRSQRRRDSPPSTCDWRCTKYSAYLKAMLELRQTEAPNRPLSALILAAGDGGRLWPRTDAMPKPLLPLAGRPIIAHVLEGLHKAGVRETVMVIGYHGEQLRRTAPQVAPRGMALRFVDNEAFELGNARSLWSARDAIGTPFVLAMADHVIDPAITQALVRGAGDRARLAVDRAMPDDPRADEATRALLRDGRVADLGKGLRNWNALDTGSFWCTRDVFRTLDRCDRDGELGAVFAHMARMGRLDAVDVTGERWVDIDTAEDLRLAEGMLEADGLVA